MGTDEELECLDYVLNQRAGTSSKRFNNSPFLRDCDEAGRPLKDRLLPDGMGFRLADFANTPEARNAKLETAHVLALRL